MEIKENISIVQEKESAYQNYLLVLTKLKRARFLCVTEKLFCVNVTLNFKICFKLKNKI